MTALTGAVLRSVVRAREDASAYHWREVWPTLSPGARMEMGRAGTVLIQSADLRNLLGRPHETDIDEKVREEWWIQTPRGMCAVHDYWWNAPGEYSIGARGDRRACLWVAAYFRRLGYQATTTAEAGPLSRWRLWKPKKTSR